MTHANRGRLAVDTNGNWRLYTNTIPAGSTPLGTVTRDGTDTGALVRIEATGVYVQVNAGSIRCRLDGRKVAAALGKAGRPPEMSGGKKVNTDLDAESIAIATRLGNGNVSAGIRKALAMGPTPGSWTQDIDTIRDERDKLKAENERLRAEVERFRTDGTRLQNNLVNLDDHRPHWVINCGTSVHVVPDALFCKWINGELPLDVEIARRILEEWRDERITDEGQGRHK